MTALSLLLLVGLFSAAGVIMAYYFLRNPDILAQKLKSNAGASNVSRTATHLVFEDGEFFIPAYTINKINRTGLRKISSLNLTIPLTWTPDLPPTRYDGRSDMSAWIIATIAKRESFLSNKDRLTRIFRFYIAGPATRHRSGLYQYRFKPASPYADIVVLTDDLANPNLLIRCELQSSSLGTRLCSRQIPISSRLVLTYKFSRANMSKWRQIHQTMQNFITQAYKRKGV